MRQWVVHRLTVCGTTPEYIALLRRELEGRTVRRVTRTVPAAVCSGTQAVPIDRVRVIGERINPTGKKLMKEALRRGDENYMLNQALAQTEAGADILDVNVGLPEIEEADMMVRTVKALQGVTDAPLQLDSTDPKVLERALRVYCGKAIVNSVNGDEETLNAILPLVKKYGVVPHEAQAETHCTNNTAELNTVLSHLLRQDALKLRTMAQEDKDTASAQEEMLNEVYRVLAVCFGEPVQKFDFTYNDAKGHYHADLGITPLEFLKKYEAEHA